VARTGHDDTTAQINLPSASNGFFFESIGEELRLSGLAARFAGTVDATAADIVV
jgi:hypothetical protein